MKKKFVLIFLLLCFFSFAFAGCANARTSASKKLSNITISAQLKDTKIEVSQTTDFLNSSDNVINAVLFSVFANVYSEQGKPVSTISEKDAYPSGKSFGGAEINAIQIGGKNAEFSFNEDCTILTVKLLQPLYPDKRVKITASFVVQLANIRHRLGYADGCFSLAHFYLAPCALTESGVFVQNNYTYYGDPFTFDSANYFVDFTAPTNFVFASSGEIKKTKQNGSTTTTKIEAPASRDFAIIGSTNYKKISKKTGKITINYFHLESENADKVLQTSADAFSFFEKNFGDVYLNSLNIVEAPLLFGGMEYSGVCVISLDARSTPEKFKEIVVHEIAHQWWFNIVGNNQFEDAWLDEALTEFSTSLFMAESKQELRTEIAKKLDALMAFCDAYNTVYGNASLKMQRPLNEFASSTEYANVVYTQGALMFYSLYEVVGEKAFLNALKSYLKQNRFKIAKKENLIAAFQKTTKMQLTNFFDMWLEGNINLAEI